MMQIFGVYSDGLGFLSASGGFKSLDSKLFPSIPDAKSGGFLKCCPSVYGPKLGLQPENYRTRSIAVRALGSSGDDPTVVSPLQFESSTGQFLFQIMQTHPHLLPAAIDQQLERLQTDQKAQKEETSSATQDLLSRRIAEVKEKERKQALEEIIYCLIVHKFMDNDILMIPAISSTSDPTSTVDFWPNQEKKLESVHSPEAFEMVQSHLSLVLGDRLVGPLNTIIQISKLRLGKLYAASIMYGYFLRRVDQRFQLERSMKTLPVNKGEHRIAFESLAPGNQLWDMDSLIQIPADDDEDFERSQLDSGEEQSFKLRSYVLYLDSETLTRYATIRSKESISLIEKQTQALFGKPDIRIAEDGSLDTGNDEVIAITFSGLMMLVLEAVTFGSFLWDAEDYVESKYHFVNN